MVAKKVEGGDISDSEPDKRPESVEISAGNLFSGDVTPYWKDDNEANVVFTSPEEANNGLSNGSWFAIGLIVAPVVVGIVSFGLVIGGESLLYDYDFDEDYQYDDILTTSDEESIDGRSYRVYDTDLYLRPDLYDDSEVNVRGQGYSCSLYDYHPEGEQWEKMTCYSWADGEADVYVRIIRNGGKVSFAVDYNTDSDRPTDANLFQSTSPPSSSGFGELMLFLSGAIWPLALIAGLIWGFTKGNKYFAYGMLVSIVAVPTFCFISLVLLVAFTFGW